MPTMTVCSKLAACSRELRTPLAADAVPAVAPDRVLVQVVALVAGLAVVPDPAQVRAADGGRAADPAAVRVAALVVDPAVVLRLQLPVSPIRLSMVPFLEPARRRARRRRIS